jgi:hypothetical protein
MQQVRRLPLWPSQAKTHKHFTPIFRAAYPRRRLPPRHSEGAAQCTELHTMLGSSYADRRVRMDETRFCASFLTSDGGFSSQPLGSAHL